MEKLIDIGSNPVASVLELLLADKSTKKNIIWATDTYDEFGNGFTDKEQINGSLLLLHKDIIKPRIQKSQEQQYARTRKKAEVFTPAWLCNLMNNYCDEEWFGRKDVFNALNEDHTWTVIEEPIKFPEKRTWKQYVDSRRLEITCGEAPYLVSRYDVSTGELIVPPKRRIGQLDRKLRIVNENTSDYDEWLKWTIRAFEATYGYEYQGDNLLIARVNLLLTFVDYYKERWGAEPNEKLLRQMTNKIVWNIWQMDGLNDTVPLGKPYEEFRQMSLFDIFPGLSDEEQKPEAALCKIYDWKRGNSLLLNRSPLFAAQRISLRPMEAKSPSPWYVKTNVSGCTLFIPVATAGARPCATLIMSIFRHVSSIVEHPTATTITAFFAMPSSSRLCIINFRDMGCRQPGQNLFAAG